MVDGPDRDVLVLFGDSVGLCRWLLKLLHGLFECKLRC